MREYVVVDVEERETDCASMEGDVAQWTRDVI